MQEKQVCVRLIRQTTIAQKVRLSQSKLERQTHSSQKSYFKLNAIYALREKRQNQIRETRKAN